MAGTSRVGDQEVTPNMLSKWMGHATLEVTAIYADALGAEERGHRRQDVVVSAARAGRSERRLIYRSSFRLI